MEEKTKPLYSQTAISIATFIGGPLAAGILVRRNAINLEHEKQGLSALITGIISTALLIWGAVGLPESVIDKIPSGIFPAIYTLIIYGIVEMIQGKELKNHKAVNGKFYSNWKAAGTGAIYLVVTAALIFGAIFLVPENWDTDKYDTYFEQYGKNEVSALLLYEMADTTKPEQIIEFITTTGIPKLKENIEIVKKMDAIPDIPQEYSKQNKILLNYCQLHIEMYGLIMKACIEDSDAYNKEIKQREQQIFELVDQLSASVEE